MKKAVLFLADGFEEIEALGTADLLRRAGISVDIAGLKEGHLTGANHVKVIPDINISQVNPDDYDAFICPGGMPGAENLKNNQQVINLISNAFKTGKLTAAICAAPMVLDTAGILNNKNFTVYPAMKNEINTGNYYDKPAVVDGNIITGSGPGATFHFAFAIIEYLIDKTAADTVKSGTLFK